MTSHEQLTAHAEEAIRLIEQIEARQAEAHKAQLAGLDELIALCDRIIDSVRPA